MLEHAGVHVPSKLERRGTIRYTYPSHWSFIIFGVDGIDIRKSFVEMIYQGGGCTTVKQDLTVNNYS